MCGKKTQESKFTPESVTKEFWRDNEHFADLFNGCFYEGRKQLDPGCLSERDADFSVNVFSKEFQKTLKRTRDVIKMASEDTCYRILAIENQQKIHYAMPLRCMVYDSLVYLNQVTDLTARNRESGSRLEPDEFLSGMAKTDRLIPCCTVVLYYGERKWDGPRTLADMMKFGNPEAETKLFCDYPMNLICMNEDAEYSFQNKDVKDLFLLTRSLYRDGGRSLTKEMSYVSTKTAYTAATITGTLDIYGGVILEALESRKEEIDMCEKVREVLEETKLEGKKEGRREGKIEGAREGKKEIALNMLKKGLDYEFVAECAGVSVETVKAWEQEACCLA